MEKENNIVKASIDIGTFIPDEKCPRFHLCTDIGDSKVEEKRERMKGLGLPQEWAEDS
jgi:hypothetical protein